MELPLNKWLNAIKIRHSRRKFIEQEIGEELKARLAKLCTEFRPFPGARALFVPNSSTEVFKGVIGSYGKIKGASSYLAFVGNQKEANIEAKLGYLGQGLVLEATSLGLNTCWVGGLFDTDNILGELKLEEDQKIFAITPVGYSEDDKNLEEKAMSLIVASDKRKPLAEIAPGYKQWPQWVQEGIKAARLGPSAMNSQPWRFSFKEEELIISAANNLKNKLNKFKRLDCGIAMLHFELAARKEGVGGKWEFLKAPQVAKYISS